MILLFLLSFAASADFSFTGKVLSLQKNGVQNNFLVQMDSISQPLEVDRGPLYYCLKKGLSSKEDIVFSFDPKSFKVRSCQSRL